ncbi:outer membrane beta-barrel family protein [Pedobacter sp. Du54]|uniref:outer membrane beta-barrel family protein n=1 Tax=Pedobacter anseongensis TaxID=3133439 RepID=UPI0030ACA42B
MKTLLQKSILIALLFISYTVAAQTKAGTASGKVLNGKDKMPLDYASVAVKRLFGDSAVAGVGTTNKTGTFSITGLTPGKYRLFVAYLGLKSINKDFELTAAAPGIDFGNLTMEDTGVDLQTVEVKGDIPPVKVKKDTLEFNAAAFKVKENAVVEDVLKKLPGVDVAKDGTITSQGETIKKVRVDGKDFMGSDPLLATRNLPADMIDKIQIIDDMSDQSKFSGVDDGNREKIINITTRQDKKNGFFGNSTVGYGQDSDNEDRYDVNVNVNKFKNDEQMSIIGQFNNVNKQNFGGGIGGFGGGRGGFGGGASGQQPGITTTNMGGINYADVYKSGTQFNGSYNVNKTSLYNTSTSFTQNFLGNTTTTNNNEAVSKTERINHRINFTLDTKIDSSISFRIQPNFSYSDNQGNSTSKYTRLVLGNTTDGMQEYISNSTSPSFSNNILLRKKFQRRGRTLSLNVNTSFNSSDADNYNEITDNVTIGNVPSVRVINQLNDQNAKQFGNNARLVFTEPLNKTLSVELNYNNSFNFDNQDRLVYNYNPVTQKYDLRDATFTNEYENTTLTNAVGFSFNKTEKKYNWNVGLAVQNTDRKNVNVSNGAVFNQNFTNLTPSAQFRYNFSNSKRLNIRYRGNTQQPSISQIQPIPDNTNTQTIALGNPNLKPSFTNSLNVFYNNFDFASFRSVFLGMFLNQQFNAFTNNQVLITDPTSVNYGKIATTPVNVDGNFNANLFGNLSQPIIKGNKLTLTIGAGASFGKSKGFSNSLENITHTLGLTNSYKLVSNLNKLDLIAGISGRMDRATYSATPNSNIRYYTLAPNIDISYLLPGNIRIQSDLTYNRLTGRGTANSDYKVVNAYISRQFFKNRGTFKFSVNDLLNENTGISRSADGNTLVDSQFNVLKRYYMLSFTYSLNKVGGKIMGAPAGGQGQRMRMGGMGM